MEIIYLKFLHMCRCVVCICVMWDARVCTMYLLCIVYACPCFIPEETRFSIRSVVAKIRANRSVGVITTTEEIVDPQRRRHSHISIYKNIQMNKLLIGYIRYSLFFFLSARSVTCTHSKRSLRYFPSPLIFFFSLTTHDFSYRGLNSFLQFHLPL